MLKSLIFIPQNFGKLNTELELCDVTSDFQKFPSPLCNLSFLCIFFPLEVELSVIIVLCSFLCRSSCVNSFCERWKIWACFFQNHQRLWPWWGRCWCTNLVPHPHERHQLWGWQGEDHGRSNENLHQAAGKTKHDFAEETAAPNGTVAAECISPWTAGSWCGLAGSTVSITDCFHVVTPKHMDHFSLNLNPDTKSSISLMLLSFEPTNNWCLFSLQLPGPSSSCFCCIVWNFSVFRFLKMQISVF